MRTLQGVFRHYAWGSTDVIPTLLGIPATGEPFAEYWLGAHESDAATIDDQPLQQVLDSHPEYLDERTRAAHDGRLPYLMKVVAAVAPMSLQAHPDGGEASRGFDGEEADHIDANDPTRIYRDPRPKDELIIATEPFHALCGFRDPIETFKLFHELHMRSSVDHLIEPLASRGGSAGLAETFLATLTYNDERHEVMPELVAAAFEKIDAPGEVGEFARTAVELDRFFPGEPAILAALLMNGVHLEPGEALFIPRTTMHSLLHGTAIEVSSCSDNVIRGGLTKKFINVDELVGTVDFTPRAAHVVKPVEVSPGVDEYQADAPDFRTWRIRPAGNSIDVPGAGLPRIAIALSGQADVTSADQHTMLTTGQALFIDATEHVTATGAADIYLAAPAV